MFTLLESDLIYLFTSAKRKVMI